MTADELIAARVARDKNQIQMAKEMGCPVSSYRKWEGGFRKVPPWVDLYFNDKSSLKIPGLSVEDIIDLDRVAREEGVTLEALIGDFIRSGLQRRKVEEK